MFQKATLLNYWKMSDLTDSAGEALLNGGSNYQFILDRCNNSNSAIYFNNGYLTVPSGVYFYGDFSVTAWINIMSSSSRTIIINFDNNILFFIDGQSLYGSTNQGSILKNISSSTKLELNTWYHVAFILKGTTGFLFVNGVQVGSGPLLSPLNVVRNSNYIGKSANAIYDEIKIYQGALTTNQVLDHYNIRCPIVSIQ